jgi:two-component system NtrC family response regulator
MGDDRPVLLYVDDEPANLVVFEALFSAEYRVLTAPSGAAALAVLERETVQVVLTDQRMPGMIGNQLLVRVSERWPTVVSVVITAYPDLDPIIEAIHAGHVHDYVLKPYEAGRLREIVRGAVAEHGRRRRLEDAVRDVGVLQEEIRRKYDPSQLVGADGGLREVMRQVRSVAPAPTTVLLIGETGTGKEMIARAIHAASPRAHRVLVKVDCGSIPQPLVESELFGHERGAFTGAVSRRAGRFEQADRGTLFLDEVGDLPLEMQSRLLRMLQDRVVDRLGGTEPVRVDVRIIAATRRDLAADVVAGRFREDLYYRLAVLPIRLPPLRERREDIPALVRHFLAKHGGARTARHEVTDQAMAVLSAHAWPGNVRELENLVERAVVLGAGPVLGPDDLAPLRGSREPRAATRAKAEQKRRVEVDRLRQALARAEGNISRAARALKLPRGTYLHRLRKHGLR